MASFYYKLFPRIDYKMKKIYILSRAHAHIITFHTTATKNIYANNFKIKKLAKKDRGISRKMKLTGTASLARDRVIFFSNVMLFTNVFDHYKSL